PSLVAIRFLFGAGEAGAWPSVARTFSRWFPLAERGRAQGIFFMGAHLAGGLTPLLGTALLEAGLRSRTLVGFVGSSGFVWAIAWFHWFGAAPAEHLSVNSQECIYIERGITPLSSKDTHENWSRLLGNKTAVFLFLMYFTQAFGGTFYVTW